jgi:hypothetical protein
MDISSGYNMPITFVSFTILPYFVLIALFVNLIQKKISKWNKKRYATLYLSILFGSLFIVSLLFLRFNIPDFLFVPVWIAAAGIVIVRKHDFFPFRLFCSNCRKLLSIRKIVFYDDILCAECGKNEPKEEIHT